MDNLSPSTEQPQCRRTRRGEQRCERVRAVAVELFLAHGYDGVSLDDIIARSGGSKTNIYSRFGGKEGLFIGIVEELCDEINGSLKAVDLSDATLEDGLEKLGRALLKAVLSERHLALYRLVIGQSGRFPAIGQPWMTHGPEATRRTLTRFLTHHKSRLRHATPEHAAIIFHNMLTWDDLNRAIFGQNVGKTQADIDRHVEQTLQAFVQGFTVPQEGAAVR